MDAEAEFVPGGGVTSPRGFLAGAASAGIKTKAGGSLDLALVFSEVPAAAAGVFTTNRVQAAPVRLSRQRLPSSRLRGIVVNAGCANAFTGERGMADAAEMAALAARRLDVAPEDVLVASTGVIGRYLPMDGIRAGMMKVKPVREGGHDLARAIMTTDTVPKEVAVRSPEGFIIGGAAKGSGMIHPDLATLLCFLTTDAPVAPDFLDGALRRAAAVSFDMVSIDGDTSTNDSVLIMANGLAGGDVISPGTGRAEAFQQALDRVCCHLAKAIARDGEGATKLIEMTVNGAATLAEARAAARTAVGSPLLKAAVYGSDPNWGRVVAAVGRSGVAMEEAKIDLYIGDACLVRSGQPIDAAREEARRALDAKEVAIVLNLNLGEATATAWGCDLTEEYVKINSLYET